MDLVVVLRLYPGVCFLRSRIKDGESAMKEVELHNHLEARMDIWTNRMVYVKNSEDVLVRHSNKPLVCQESNTLCLVRAE